MEQGLVIRRTTAWRMFTIAGRMFFSRSVDSCTGKECATSIVRCLSIDKNNKMPERAARKVHVYRTNSLDVPIAMTFTDYGC